MDVPDRLDIPDYEFRLVLGRTKIDYDPSKESSNRKNHKYSLESAVYLLKRILLETATCSTDNRKPYIMSDSFIENSEVRHMHMSVDDNGYVVLMVTTMRPDETVRIISFRKANKRERETFKQETGYVET